MKRALVTVIALSALGCGGAGMRVARVGEAEQTRTGLARHDAQALAPQVFAEADQALRAAKDAERDGDALAAELHAERAIATYQHAIALARLARATDDDVKAKEALARAVEQSSRYTAARKAAERETADLEKQLEVARSAEPPAASRPADPKRERARLVAARSLATQARLLCSAARLVSRDASGLAEAEAAATALENELESTPKSAPIDAAARARAACLGALTKARRANATNPDRADALLGELSRATDPKATRTIGLAPSRDERGVVVTLRSLFHAGVLSNEGAAVLADLGRVAAAHPDFALQIVLHDAARPTADELVRGKKHGEAIADALVAGGADRTKTKIEQAGARTPVFDPADAKRRSRNARVEIVFVGGS